MTNTRTKLTILILMLTLSFSVFAKGDGEKNRIYVDDPSGNPYLSLATERSYGKVIYKFNTLNKAGTISHVVVKVGDDYYNQVGDKLENQDFFRSKFNSLNLLETTINVDGHEEPVLTGGGSVTFDYSEKMNLDEARAKKKLSQISINSSIEKVDITVWRINEAGNVFQISTKLIPSFFRGEHDFYNKFFSDKRMTQLEQIIFFMSTFLIEEKRNFAGELIGINNTSERTEFIRIACSILNVPISNIPYLNDVLGTDINEINDIYPELIRHQNIFKTTFASHFKMNIENVIKKDTQGINKNEAELPFLDISKDSFDIIYGRGKVDFEKRNPHISAYLGYIASDANKSSKPILSYLINKKMNEGKILNKVNYDYTQYRQIDLDEGISIARAALRYMTWGVEYTPKDDISLENNRSDIQVYADNYEELCGWVYNKTINDKKRDHNYFSGKVDTFSIPDYVSSDSALGILYDRQLITSPFKNSVGNPIAFAPVGIDTPKTFNYKMLEQNRARKWIIERYPTDGVDPFIRDHNKLIRDNFPAVENEIVKTTLAQTITAKGLVSYFDSYVDEIELYKEDDKIIVNNSSYKYNDELPEISNDIKNIKPFLPGFKTPLSTGFVPDSNSMYHPNKVAGVDSLGLLMGSMASAKINGTFLNAFNTKVSEKLDMYNRSGTGDSPEGFPQFHVTNENDQIKKPYRFSKSDIERSTILLPDLSMARPGDILVNFTKNEPHIGVIVSADFSNLDETSTTENYMENIIVVSIRSGYRMANVGVWKNPNNIFSGFTAPGEEKSYHLRRLLTLPNDVEDFNKYKKDNFEVFDQELLGLYVDMDIDSHWIPNTGELLEIKSIRITGNYLGEKTSLRDEDKEIKIMPPLDQYHHDIEGKEIDSNIYQNKGTGLKFFVIGNKGYAILLASFTLNNFYPNKGESPYDVKYNPDIFTEDGRSKKGSGNIGLYVENDRLKFRDSQGISYSRFAVRPFDRNNIRPGDDFLLRFGLTNDSSIVGEAEDNDFIAIYDKKLLWRANLFIDERKSGERDWNVANPWDAPTNDDNQTGISEVFPLWHGFSSDGGMVGSDEEIWFGSNEWNYQMHSNEEAEKFKVASNWEDLSELRRGNGEQVVSFPSAVYNKENDHSSRSVVHDYMVYNFIRTTSPFQYYNNMMIQFRAMEEMRDDFLMILIEKEESLYEKKSAFENDSSQENKSALEKAEDEFNEAKKKFDLYDSLDSETLLPPLGGISPGGGSRKPADMLTLWSRYAPDAPKPAAKDSLNIGYSASVPFVQPDVVYGPLKWLVTTPAPTPENADATIEVNKLYEVPGFEEYKLPPEPIPSEQNFSNEQAGVDCGGLIYMSEAYEGTKYISNDSNNILAEIAERHVHDVGPGTSGYKNTNSNNLYEIMRRTDYRGDAIPSNRKRVIPGDIIFYPGYHVAMVQDVKIVNGNREISLSDIVLIESTHHSGIHNAFGQQGLWGVGNNNNLGFYHDKKKPWILGRLKYAK